MTNDVTLAPGTNSPQSSDDRLVAADRRHFPPPESDERWQESWGLVWFDPTSRAGGFHHFGLQVPRERADISSFLVLDGNLVAHEQSLDRPLPSGDLPDLRFGGLHIRTESPTRAYAVTAAYQDAVADIRYTAFAEPSFHSIDFPGASVGVNHYESVGAITGVLSHRGRDIALSGFALQDHSWGPRDYSALITHRWIWATFGPDLHLYAWGGWTPAGRHVVGYVHDAGHMYRLKGAKFRFEVDDDGHTPVRCVTDLWTTDDRAYQLTGTAQPPGMLNRLPDGFFMTDCFATFEMGGRLGAGIMECRELGTAPPWHADYFKRDDRCPAG